MRTILLKALLRLSIPIKPIFYNLVGRPLWDHARDCATACKTLAPNHQIDADDGYLLGLVHDAGKLVIFKLLCSAFRATSATVSPRAGIVARMVQRYANELSHCLAQHWNFPASFLNAIERGSITLHQQLTGSCYKIAACRLRVTAKVTVTRVALPPLLV